MKLRIQKLQLGGEFASLAVNYIPTSASTTAGAYAPAIASSNDSSKSSKSEKDELSIKDVLKVFDNVKGLPIDVQYVLRDFKQMFTDDTLFSFSGKPSYSSLVSYYLNNIGKFNQLAHSKELYEEARKELVANNSLDEIAINRNGRIIVATEDGPDAVTMEEFKKGNYQALTNRELLNLRQKSLPFGDTIYNSMTGVGIDSVIKKVNSLVHNLGNSEKKIEGYTTKQSDSIRSGLALLQDRTTNAMETGAMTVDGLYKNSVISKDQKEQAELALKAVYSSLTPQERTLLSLHSQGRTPTETLSNIIFSRTSSTYEFKPTLQATLNVDGTKKETSAEKATKEGNDNPLTQMQEQKGGVQEQLTLITKEGTTAMHTTATTYPHLNKINRDMSINEMLNTSGIAGIIQGYQGITMGDQTIPFENLKDIMYENRGGSVAVLPVTTDVNGNKKVDLSILDTYNKIVDNIDVEKGSPQWYQELAKGLKEEGLDQYLQGSDSIDPKRFGLFLMVTGYTTDRWNFKKDSQYIEKVAPSKDLEQRMSTALSTDKENKNYQVDVDDWGLGWLFEGGYDDIYRGTIYIPINPNRNAAISAYGSTVDHSIGELYERNYQDLLSGKIDKQKDISSDILNEQ